MTESSCAGREASAHCSARVCKEGKQRSDESARLDCAVNNIDRVRNAVDVMGIDSTRLESRVFYFHKRLHSTTCIIERYVA